MNPKSNSGEILAQELFDYETDPPESINMPIKTENAALLKALSAQLNAGWKVQLPDGLTNPSDNPLAPPSYTWGGEGVSRRAAWHATFGGAEEEGWRKATERRLEYQKLYK